MMDFGHWFLIGLSASLVVLEMVQKSFIEKLEAALTDTRSYCDRLVTANSALEANLNTYKDKLSQIGSIAETKEDIFYSNELSEKLRKSAEVIKRASKELQRETNDL